MAHLVFVSDSIVHKQRRIECGGKETMFKTMYLCTGFRQNTLAEYTSGYIVGTFIISARVERQSCDKTKHINTKDVVGLLLVEVDSKY
jgi:hypothetical protein